MSVTLLQPIFGPHLYLNYGYEGLFTGFAFAVPTFIYAAGSNFIYLLTQRMKKSGVIFNGYVVMSLAMLCIGPSTFLMFP